MNEIKEGGFVYNFFFFLNNVQGLEAFSGK